MRIRWRKLDHHALQVMRQQAIKAVTVGQPVSSVTAAFGLNASTVFRWIDDAAAYAADSAKAFSKWIGWGALENTPTSLSDTQPLH